MIKASIITALLGIICCVSGTTPPRITIGPTVGNSSLGVVPGVKLCGGHGKFVEWRSLGCKPEEVPCHIFASAAEKWTSEVDFIPHESIIQLVAKSRVSVDGGPFWTQYEIPIISSSVYPGVKYTVRFDSPGVAMKGKMVKIQGIFYRVDPIMTNEICIEAEFELH